MAACGSNPRKHADALAQPAGAACLIKCKNCRAKKAACITASRFCYGADGRNRTVDLLILVRHSDEKATTVNHDSLPGDKIVVHQI